jgi:hypothetical protein
MKYFKVSDFDCQETGENEMEVGFMKVLDHLRAVCGFPFIITSGYRSPNHSIEAADIKVSGGAQRLAIVKHASAMGMSVGVAKTFVHVDTRKTEPMCWCY